MSKNIKLNDTNYTGISTVQLPTTDGGTATFKDTDEITTPSGTVTITENGTHNVANYASAVVNVPLNGSGDADNNLTLLEALIGWDNYLLTEDMHLSVPSGITKIRSNAFYQMTNSATQKLLYLDLPDTIEEIGNGAFSYNTRIQIGKLPPNLKKIGGSAFAFATCIFDTSSSAEIEIPASVEEIAALAFYNYNGGGNTLTFKGTPTSIATNGLQGKFTTINVPWSEGEVANAPWGATNATINYNYTGA